MSQTYTSANTSMNAHKLPRVFRKIQPAAHTIVFDFGAGRYTDHIRAALPNVVYCPYDPYNQPDDVNAVSVSYLKHAMYARYPVTVVCSNVLNVIDDDDTLQQIAHMIMNVVYRTGGTGYVTVYAGDGTGRGRQTGADQYQRNEPLREYLRLFPVHCMPMQDGSVIRTAAHIERGMIVVTREVIK